MISRSIVASFDEIKLTDIEKNDLFKRILSTAERETAGSRQRIPAYKLLVPIAAAAAVIAGAAIFIPRLAPAPAPATAPEETSAPAAPRAEAPASPAYVPDEPAAAPGPETLLAEFADPSEYGGFADSMKVKAAGPGEVVFAPHLRQALDDPATDGKWFFVELMIFDVVGASELGRAEDYVFNGRTMAEWRVLTDLANGLYPFEEYRGDHGGSVTEEEYEAAVTEARTLDAEKNLAAAEEEYAERYEALYPDIEALRLEAIKAEQARLKELLIDAELYETWEYTGTEGEHLERTVLAAKLSKEQLLSLPDEYAGPRVGRVIEWMRNGDGIMLPGAVSSGS